MEKSTLNTGAKARNLSNLNHNNLLRKAARVWGLQTSYMSATGELVKSSDQGLLALLGHLTQSQIKTSSDLDSLISRKHQLRLQQGLEPTLIAWENQPSWALLTIPNQLAQQPGKLSINQTTQLEIDLQSCQSRQLERGYKQFRIDLPNSLPLGYHDLLIEVGDKEFKSVIVRAPDQLHSPYNKKTWGAFLPLYALRSSTDWGIGSYTELKSSAHRLGEFGAKWFGCLPLLALPKKALTTSPSPYSPSSRLFFNEIYLDIDELASRDQVSEAMNLIGSTDFQSQLRKLREADYVDYPAVYKLKAQVLKILANAFFASGQHQQNEFKEFNKQLPELGAYAALCSQDPEQQRLHQFAQFESDKRLSEFANLYMDYPVGVSPDGFDASYFAKDFFHEAIMGAPPEPLFPKGQGWGFSPQHPEHIRQNGYAYFRRSLRQHLRHSKILRIDHVMGLHRAYVVAKEFSDGKDGAYLRYKPEDLFAVACLEAHLAGADLVGENLGTVPRAVNEILHKRHFKGMWVAQFEMHKDEKTLTHNLQPDTLACINTHDTASFAGYLQGEDLTLSQKLGIISDDVANHSKQERLSQLEKWDKDQLLRRLIQILAKTEAKYLLINPEDLWEELRFQNMPGTSTEVPNWQRKFVGPLDQLIHGPLAQAILKVLQAERGS